MTARPLRADFLPLWHRAPVKALTDHELREVSRVTLADYESRADSFWRGTRHHDVSQNIDALLANLPGVPPHDILDLGCGPGRDLAALRELGHAPIGLDGCESFVATAREQSGCEVWVQDLLALDLPEQRFDGVFANATLFHVPRQEIERVLAELRACLRPGGVLFSSNPRGSNQEGFYGDRFACYHDFDGWRARALAAGFEEIDHYYRPPGKPRAEQPWLASLWRNPAATGV